MQISREKLVEKAEEIHEDNEAYFRKEWPNLTWGDRFILSMQLALLEKVNEQLGEIYQHMFAFDAFLREQFPDLQNQADDPSQPNPLEPDKGQE